MVGKTKNKVCLKHIARSAAGLMGRMNKFTLLRAVIIVMRGYLMDGTTLGLLLTKTIAAILLRLQKPSQNP